MSSYYSDNLKYIGEALRAEGKKYQLIYAGKALKCFDELENKGITPIELNSLKFFYYGMTSKVIVTNSGGVSYLPLKKSQFVINTWHGGGAYKKIGIDMYEDSKLFRKDLLLAARETDVMLTTCERFKEIFCRAMLIPENKFWSIGMPRNDCLLQLNHEKEIAVKNKLGLSDTDRLVLFAPTYRKVDDNYFNDSVAVSYGINEEMVLNALHNRFGGDWVFAYRYHPCIVNKQTIQHSKRIIDLSDYDDMQELLLAADVLINDFSSSMWDFMLTGKPCFIFAKDLKHYIETTDLYTPLEEWPFPVAESNEKLDENIREFDELSYKTACRKHYDALGGCESGKATQYVCEKISLICV